MNRSVLKKSLLALVMAGVAGSALAAPDAVVNVSGTITNQTCTVAAANVNQSVTLPILGSNALLNASSLQPVTFQFDISG